MALSDTEPPFDDEKIGSITYRTELNFGYAKQARKKASLGKVKVRGTHHGHSIQIGLSVHSHDALLSAAI